MVKDEFIETDVKDLLPLKKLDETLKYLLDASKPTDRTPTQVQKDVSFEADLKEINEILEKLVKDGYVVTETNHLTMATQYRSTFDGRYFITETGGYLERAKDDYRQRARVGIRNRQDQLNQKLLTFGAIWAAAAGTALVIWEVVEYFLKKCS
jgi:hypothetical protein